MSDVPKKEGWILTFNDDFDRPQLNDMYWFPAYRSGRKEYFKRIGMASRWVDHNAHYVIEDSILKLRIDRALPFRPTPQTPCVSALVSSDHRFGETSETFQVLEKFSQKYGWFEIRAKCVSGSGLMSAFWLHQVDPTKQEYTPEGERKDITSGPLEIDIFEQRGVAVEGDKAHVDLNTHFTEKGHFFHELHADVVNEFHVWAMEWEEGRIRWYFDGELMEEYIGETPREKMFMLVALFQYEGWLGPIDPDLPYPMDFEIDYIRVWRKA